MINMDFSQALVINTSDMDWVASPRPGVWRKPLARENAERGHATSVVRYDPGASFSAHNHPQGEEILVLDGTFSDETGDYHKGTYFRNPEGFRHAPFSEPGCIILVKLHQFQSDDSEHVCIKTNEAQWQTAAESVEQLTLHQFNTEDVSLFRLGSGTALPLPEGAGAYELFIVNGELADKDRRYGEGTWMRAAETPSLVAGEQSDALVWLKTGHF